MISKSLEIVGTPCTASAVIFVVIIIPPEDREVDVLKPFLVL